jgi:acyl-CoA hydrolase
MEIPELHLEKIKENTMCFGCGKDNPQSLKMKLIKKDGTAKGEFLPTECHQSWPGHVHGGALLAVLDEGIGWAAFSKNIYAVTAKIEVRLKSMARIGEPLEVSANIIKQTSRTVEVEARINRRDGSVVAEAAALLFIVK